MTVTEANIEELGLSQQELAGFALSMSREELRGCIFNPNMPLDIYEAKMAEYLNAIQGVYFEMSIEQRHFAINNMARIVKTEAECLLQCGVEPLEDIEQQLDYYIHDRVARELKHQSISRAPRAFSLALLDTINAALPFHPTW
jgi:hypothetical protein